MAIFENALIPLQVTASLTMISNGGSTHRYRQMLILEHLADI